MRIRRVIITALTVVAACVTSSPASALGTVTTIPVGSSPYGIALTPDGSRAYVTNSGDGTVSVIDLETRSVTTTITTGGQPWALAISPDGSKLFVADILSGDYDVIRTSDNTITTTVPQDALCPNPTSLAFHPSGTPVYVGCGGFQRVFSIDASTYAMTQVFLGSNAVNDVAVSGDASELVDAGGSEVTFNNVGWPAMVTGIPRAITLSYDGETAYTANVDGTVSAAFEPTRNVETWTAGQSLSDIVLRESIDRLYLTDSSADRLIIQTLSTRETRATVPVGRTPTSLAINADETFAYVVSLSDNSVSVVDLTTRSSDPDAPTAALQQFARAESDPCESQPDDLVDFPALDGHRNVAWAASWAQWPNGGTGGFVCTRQPYYTSAGTWAVE